MSWEAVIGLESHVELATRSKMFCGCPVEFGADPNTRGCPVCLGLPGALPVPNEQAIGFILRVGAALECDINEHSVFHRKNYFYPDLPKNYQISQYDEPICVGGHVDVETEAGRRRVGITRVHMEEDTGKSIHVGRGGRIESARHSLLDFNRSGVPLIEVVTEPDLRTPDEARVFAQELQTLVRALGVSDAKLEEGSMRFDANVSLRPPGADDYGTKVEVKNMNSLRSLHQALEYEIERQSGLLDAGAEVVQETRHWEEAEAVTQGMRSKEESEDYRYFQEPDLVPLHIDSAWQKRVLEELPELPRKVRARLEAMGIESGTASLLVDEPAAAALFETAVGAGSDPARIANWLTGEIVAHLRRDGRSLAETPLAAEHLVELDALVSGDRVSATAAKEVLGGVLDGEGSPEEIVAARDLGQMTDIGALETEVDAVLASNPDAAAKVLSGEQKPVGFLVGQVMKATGGKADPRRVAELIREKAQQ